VRDLLALAGRALGEALGARSGHPGPVHLDLAYREPLVPLGSVGGAAPAAAPAPAPGAARATAADAPSTTVVPARAVLAADQPAPGARTVVVAGDGAGPVAREHAEARGWPLLAEPSSGALGGAHLVVAHPLVLGVDEL